MINPLMLGSSDVGVVRKDGKYYVVQNRITDDMGEVYFEVVCELVKKANDFFMCGYKNISLTPDQKEKYFEGSD